MSRQQMSAHYARLLARWPTDRLRPEPQQFQKLLRSRISQPSNDGNASATAAPTTRDDRAEVNAAYLLLDNAFTKHYSPVSARLMTPDSVPQHYEQLGKELEEIPDRTWASGLWKRLSNMVRLK